MGLLRLILWGLLIYFGYRVIKQTFSSGTKGPRVQGKAKKKSLNIDESQIEDADYEDLDK